MTTVVCLHHWLIPMPHGVQELEGRCKKCGATRTFPAWLEDDTLGSKNARLARQKKAIAASLAARQISPVGGSELELANHLKEGGANTTGT